MRQQRTAKRNANFEGLLAQQGKITPQRVLALAQQEGIPTTTARRIGLKFGIQNWHALRPTIETLPAIDPALLKNVFLVFQTHERLFLSLAKPYLRIGVPLEMLYDACMDGSIATAERFDPKRNVRLDSWVTNYWRFCMRNASQRYAYRSKREVQIIERGEKEKDWFWNALPSRTRGPEQKAILFEQRRRLYKALMELPENQRIVIKMRYGIGTGISESLETVASAFGISIETVRNWEKKAKNSLHRILKTE